jgi:hypothetical protein
MADVKDALKGLLKMLRCTLTHSWLAPDLETGFVLSVWFSLDWAGP